MPTDDPVLVVLRGNSGAGKSTVAREVLRRSPEPIALVQQDYLRRLGHLAAELTPFKVPGEMSGRCSSVRQVTDEEDWDDGQDLGSAAELLFEQGKTQAASLLLDAKIVERQYLDIAFLLPLDDRPGITLFAVTLEVPRFLVERFTVGVQADVQEALNEVLERDRAHVKELNVRAAITPAGDDWRETLAARMQPRATNQANIGPRQVQPLMEDRCAFRSREELRVYQAFKRVREQMPVDDTIAILPNPALVLRSANTSEPDLVITYRGRVGIVQVDGPHHRGRFAAEATRDRLYRHSGVAEVDHFPVEDSESDEDLDFLVTSFLRRLGKR